MDGETGLDSMPIVDARGGGFDLIRSLGLPLGVWCVPTAGDLGEAAVPFAMLAVYSGDELDRAHGLMKRTPTLVIGVGMGPRVGPRALQLGAVGYAHDALGPVAIRDVIGEAIIRAQWRLSRASS